MAIDLKSLTSTKSVLPPRVLIYGPPGLGKTSLALDWPAPILIDIEQGVPDGREVHSFGEIDGYDAVIAAVSQLITDEHDFKTVVVDSLDKLEPLVWAKCCADNNWSSIEDPGFGKGYVLTDSYWQKLFDGFNHLRRLRGMNIVMIAHSDVSRFDSPTTAPYSRYDIRLHKRALALVQDDVDVILFVNQEATIKDVEVGPKKKVTHAEGGGTRWIYAEGRPAMTAKNRYCLPDRIMFAKGQGYAALAPFFPTPPAAAAAQLETQ